VHFLQNLSIMNILDPIFFIARCFYDFPQCPPNMFIIISTLIIMHIRVSFPPFVHSRWIIHYLRRINLQTHDENPDIHTLKSNVLETPLGVHSNQHYTHSTSYICFSLIVHCTYNITILQPSI
jgi:hypothetical protein